jgi:uncharacterized protein with HEPN domain
MRDSKERLRDILEAIDRVERYAEKGRREFESNELIQTWFVHHLQIIGEAARSLPAEVRHRAPDIPWKEIIGMRHILVHHYSGISTGVVWGGGQRTSETSREACRGVVICAGGRQQ